MNSRHNNEKIIKRMQENEPIFDNQYEPGNNDVEDSHIDKATFEPPLAFARKAVGWLCIAVWGFAILSLVFGFADVTLMFPIMLIALGLLAVFNIPVFWYKHKKFDIVVAIIAAVVCFYVGIGMLVFV